MVTNSFVSSFGNITWGYFFPKPIHMEKDRLRPHRRTSYPFVNVNGEKRSLFNHTFVFPKGYTWQKKEHGGLNNALHPSDGTQHVNDPRSGCVPVNIGTVGKRKQSLVF